MDALNRRGAVAAGERRAYNVPMRHSPLLAALLLLAVPAAAQGEPFVPDVMVFAGSLERSGAPVNGTVSVAAALFDGPDASASAIGAPAADASALVVEGVLVLEMPSLLGLVDGRRAFLELTIDGETLAPRVPLGAVPWAQRAASTPWDGVTGVPADLLDGDDQAVSPGDLTAISPVQISSGQIGIRSDSISATHLAASSVGSSEIANASITAADIAYGTLTVDEIGSDAVGWDELRNSSVGSPEIIDDSITAADIAYGTITVNELGSDSVGADEMRNDAVVSAEIVDGSVTAADLAFDSVGGAELQTDAVSAIELATGAVDTDAMVNGAVTDVKMALGAVTRSALSGTEVSVREIDNGFCEGAGALTTLTYCTTRACGGVVSGTDVALRFFTCAGACTLASPTTCTLTTTSGFLLSASMP